MFNTLNVLEHILCIFLFGGIKYHGHLYFDVLVAKADLYNVSDLNVIGRLNYFAVYKNSACVTGFICNGPSLDKS